MNQFDFYDDELKKKEEEEARLRNAQQPPYGAGGDYYASGQAPDGNGAPYYTDGGDGNMNNGFGGAARTAAALQKQKSSLDNFGLHIACGYLFRGLRCGTRRGKVGHIHTPNRA